MNVIIIRHRNADIVMVSASVEGAVTYLNGNDYTLEDGSTFTSGGFSEELSTTGSALIIGPDGEELVAEVHPLEM